MVKKRNISIRLDEDMIERIDEEARRLSDIFFGRGTRTIVIETALKNIQKKKK